MVLSIIRPSVQMTYEFQEIADIGNFSLDLKTEQDFTPVQLQAFGLPDSSISHVVEEYRNDYSMPGFTFKVLEFNDFSALCQVINTKRDVSTTFSLTVIDSAISL